jgi:hypothetical protein
MRQSSSWRNGRLRRLKARNVLGAALGLLALVPLFLVAASAPAGADPTYSETVTSVARPSAESAPFIADATVLGMVASSPSNAWVAGFLADRLLLAHWNGKTWSRVTSLEADGVFTAISMDSPSDVWAVGSIDQGATSQWLVAHWNGKTWSRDTSVPRVQGQLVGVVAVDGDVWVSGYSAAKDTLLMLHRTGGHWYVVPTSAPATSSLRASFAASSRTSIWASIQSNAGASYLLHWNGSVWKKAALPAWAASDYLSGLSAAPGGRVWAVGENYLTDTDPLSMYWNGKGWARVAVPAVKGASIEGVAAIPGGTVWAVGGHTETTAAGGYAEPLILHWSGKAWTIVKSPQIGSPTYSWGALSAVTATSSTDAWALGWECADRCNGLFSVLLHWNGKTWS